MTWLYLICLQLVGVFCPSSFCLLCRGLILVLVFISSFSAILFSLLCLPGPPPTAATSPNQSSPAHRPGLFCTGTTSYPVHLHLLLALSNAQKRELITRGSQPAPMPPKPGHITTFSPTTQMPVPLLFSTVPCLPHQFNALPTPVYKIYSPYVSVPTMCLRGPSASSSISSSSSERHSVQ